MDALKDIGAYAYPYAALATLVMILLISIFSITVGKMREKHGIKAPASIGHIEFESANRVHLNTIEQAVIFLPVMWIFAATVSDLYAGAAGALWIVGRLVYSRGYMEEPAKRHNGFMIGFVAFIIPFFWSLYAVVMQLV
jgi:glutathione S-transferase